MEDEEEEEQLLYRVPVFDPALAFGDTPPPPHPPPTASAAAAGTAGEFVPTEIEMAEFAANMDSLLGRGFHSGEAFCMEELGLGAEGCGGGRVEVEEKGKTEEEEEEEKGDGLSFDMEVDLSRETLELDFGCGSSEMKEEEAAEAEKEVSKGMGLRLDYEAVKEAWLSTGSSPWMSGERPLMGVEDYWLECLVSTQLALNY